MSAIKAFLSRKNDIAPACMMPLNGNTADMAGDVHTQACFSDIMPLSVVELFQSQGCKSCPPVVPLVHEAAMNPNLLLLTYDVTYWDQSGWKDTFGSPMWDQRQRSYVTRWGRNGIFTPQVVVDGVSDGIGNAPGDMQKIIQKAMEARNGMAWMIMLERNFAELKIMSTRAEAETFDVLVVKYDPMAQEVKVGKGPNKGKKIMHRNLVKELMKVGEWNGGESVIHLPEMPRDRFERVVLVQGGAGGPIVAALKL